MRELEDQERAKLEEIKHLEKQVKHKATAEVKLELVRIMLSIGGL